MAIVVLGASALGVIGCAAIADVDFDSVRLGSNIGDASMPDGFLANIPKGPDGTSGGGGGCAADEKICNGACVKKSDPLFGCGATSCAPCSLPNATAAKCDPAGGCAVDTCAPGRKDCNGAANDGCEADLSTPATCGACNVACDASAPLCAPAGCALDCPGGTTQCGSSCVDTATSTAHCGGCNMPCPVLANGSPTCAGGKCGTACSNGFGECDGNPGNGCEALGTFYQDGDGDGVGGPNVQKACSAPGGWVAVGGDCHDGNGNVHPGQTAYFGAPYTNTGGQPSFDYDCNGNADEDPAAPKLTDCGPSCNQSGYVVNNGTYCGSTIGYQCGYIAPNCPDICYTNPIPECGLVCVPQCGVASSFTPPAFGCR